MTRYTATEARRQFFQILDAAQRGEEVVLDRNGVRFRLTAERTEAVEPPASPLIILDQAVLSGEWMWISDEFGELQFQPTGATRDDPDGG